ncbi:aspartate aminotransferase family protein [Carboxydocella sp. ULO1]|uniref:aspartate aminotransferase family protein n=1 Tax=Carboxydocella sp. ULO1 TaxID=1926599 RepID=UPI0009ACA2D2|nr:aspartate aminotransferase family protein [Carboxydocella sp. ULO1]GAW28865.1 aspartate aminotransferase family protein [Carboxydocella sp. ULO1]
MEKKYEKCVETCKEDSKVVSFASRIHYYPLVVKKAKGAIVEDLDGNEYIDFLASAGALNTGHSHENVVEAIKNQVDNFIHYTTGYMYNRLQVELAKRLIEITPGNFPKKVAFGLTGSDANDGAIKFSRAYTGRRKIISFIKSYHGSTFGSISLSAISLKMRRKIGPILNEVYHIPYPFCYRCPLSYKKDSCGMVCIKELENAFESFLPPEEVAAVVMEPIAGDGGIIIPPKEYVKRLYQLCKENGILFISDEVQQGFGRTGKWFGIEHFNVEPDIIVMGKAIASGMPLSAIVGRSEIMDSLEAPAHLFTMNGHPVSCSAAIATIDIIKDEKLVEKSRVLGEYALMRFEELKEKYEIIGDVRGCGLSIGVELIKDRKSLERNNEAAKKICYRCFEKGLILTFFAGNVLRVQPPLVITKEELDRGLDIIEESIIEYLEGKIPDSILEESKGW